MFILEVKN